ncbi:hypothetical protein TNCV_2028191 [Trichonephila clavipes]|nr:hypothetical protein TNCV_2028191 [Trichonephila clavipes]
MALYRSPLIVTLWPSSFLKMYGPMIPSAHKAHQTTVVKEKTTEDEEELVGVVSSDNAKDQGEKSDEIERKRKL